METLAELIELTSVCGYCYEKSQQKWYSAAKCISMRDKHCHPKTEEMSISISSQYGYIKRKRLQQFLAPDERINGVAIKLDAWWLKCGVNTQCQPFFGHLIAKHSRGCILSPYHPPHSARGQRKTWFLCLCLLYKPGLLS